MKTSKKLYSTALVSAALILVIILVSSTVSAANKQNASPTITETKITTSEMTQALTAGIEEMSENTEVTVYNEGLALVKEKREIDLKNGTNSLEYVNVASQIDPTSVLVEDPTNNKTVVLEQQYEYDLVSSSNLLDKYMGKEITVTDREGKTQTGKLLSHDEKGVVLESNNGSVVALDALNNGIFKCYRASFKTDAGLADLLTKCRKTGSSYFLSDRRSELECKLYHKDQCRFDKSGYQVLGQHR